MQPLSDVNTFGTVAEAGALVKQAMLSRAASVSFGVELENAITTQEELGAVMSEIMDIALMHNGI